MVQPMDVNSLLEQYRAGKRDFWEVALPGSQLYGENLSRANFQKADLNHASLYRANLMETSLFRANLSSADLALSNLVRANLSYADLSGANLTGADLRGAILTGANFQNASMRGVLINGAIIEGANFKGTQFEYDFKDTYSKESNTDRLKTLGLLVCHSQQDLAELMGVNVVKLRFLAFPRKVSHYTQFQLPKKTGGKRLISAPQPQLKKVQNWILHHVLEKLEVSDAAHGFCRNRSIVTNAQPHVGAKFIINIDFKNFFPSISYKRVLGLFKSFGYSERVSRTFAALCTGPEVKEVESNGKKYFAVSRERFLPQGAPTSPAISNLICRRLDRRLSNLSKSFNFTYTRYADDLTLSTLDKNEYRIGILLKKVESIVKDEDFGINKAKTKVLHSSRQQEVTGIVVNKKLNVSRSDLKRFRATLFQMEREGLQDKYWGKSDDLIASIQGFANFVYMVNPQKGKVFQEQVQRIKNKYEDRRPTKPMNYADFLELDTSSSNTLIEAMKTL